jgi:hypothetical protein
MWIGTAHGDEKRAPAPTFDSTQLKSVFFDKLDDAIRGQRPSLATLRSEAPATNAATKKPGATSTSGGEQAAGGWSKLISAASLEDEVKRVRLRFDNGISTPGAFNGGGFQDARRDLSILATLFAVIGEYNSDVRWKDQANAARELLARSAFNCKAGSTQVYNEVKLRKNDLEDLISGSGLANREAAPLSEWSAVVDRTPMMKYLEELLNGLKEQGADEGSIQSNSEVIKRQAELVAMVGDVLVQSGMVDADDEDYKKLSVVMSAAGTAVSTAIQRSDWKSVREGIGAIGQSCDSCHEQYR